MKKLLYFLFFSAFLTCSAFSQESLTIQEYTTGMEKHEGFFTFYWNENSGDIYLEINKLNQDFLYVNFLATGIGSNKIGLDKGQLGKTKVVYFEKIANKIYLIERNLKYRSLSDNPAEQKAIEESFPPSILHAWFIDTQEDNTYLINLSEFLLRDAHGVTDQLHEVKEGSYQFDFLRSAMYMERTKSFPKNTEFEALISFVGQGKFGKKIQEISPNPQILTVRQHHSFIELPDQNYTPRAYSIRSGFFPLEFYDFNSPIHKDLKTRYIARHRLQKKHPNAEKSKPVKPIIYYVDREIPEPFRTAVMEGASWWNKAFEEIGFKDAFQVKLLPEGTDPLDIRYNVIRWVHRKERGWSYGASVRDPRTGEIIKGNVILGALRVRHDYLIAQGLLSPFENDNGENTHPELLNMTLARLRQLSAHEVGHTLGLMHNFASSANGGSSVMDYPHPKIKLTAQNKLDLSEAYYDKLGDWDRMVIAYGYSEYEFQDIENQEIKKILDSALKQNLHFISDQDARDLGGLHPKAHLWDNGADATEELAKILKIRKIALEQFSEKNIPIGTPNALLEEVLVPIYNLHRYQAEATAKLIGGMNYSYSARGDNQPITEIVLAKKQEKALDVLLECLSPEVLTLPEKIIHLIPPRPVSYENTDELFARKTGLSFDPISTADVSANHILTLLLHPERASRLIEFEARFGGLGLLKVYEKLLEKTWKAERKMGLELEIQRNTEQVVLRHLLTLSQSAKASGQVKAITFFQVRDLRNFIEIELKNESDLARKAHLQYALYQIDNPKNESLDLTKKLPRGAPLGCESHFGHE